MFVTYMLIFKIMISSLIPREGSSNQNYWDHKHFIWFLVNWEKINMNAYMFNYLCEVIKEINKHNKKNVPFVRLLSELFHHNRLVQALEETSENYDMEEKFENILFGSIIGNMKIISKKVIVKLETDLRIRNAKSAYIDDYPVISKMDNLEVIQEYIKLYKEETGVTVPMKNIPNAPLDVYRASRKRKVDASID